MRSRGKRDQGRCCGRCDGGSHVHGFGSVGETGNCSICLPVPSNSESQSEILMQRRRAQRRNGKPLRLCVRTPEFAPCRRLRLLKKLTRNSRSPKPPNLTTRRLVRDELTLVPFGLPRGGKFPRMSYPKSIALDFLTSAACSLSCFFFLCSPTRTPPRTRSFSNPSNIRKTAPPKSRIPENPRETRSS